MPLLIPNPCDALPRSFQDRRTSPTAGQGIGFLARFRRLLQPNQPQRQFRKVMRYGLRIAAGRRGAHASAGPYHRCRRCATAYSKLPVIVQPTIRGVNWTPVIANDSGQEAPGHQGRTKPAWRVPESRRHWSVLIDR